MEDKQHHSVFDRLNAPKTEEENKRLLKRKRWIAVISAIIVVVLFFWLAWFLTKTVLKTLDGGEDVFATAKNFQLMIESYGKWGWIVAFGIQVLQVVVSPIPGEVVEVGMGLCFGWFWGTVICMVGGALAAWLIMLFVRKFGVKFVELFVSTEKINELRFINNEKKLKRTAFLLYLIPGTPKDPLIFFFGLTKINIWDFVWIQMVARIPSIVTSAVAGEMATNQNWLGAVIIFAVTGAIALIGIFFYRRLISNREAKKEIKEQEK